MRQIVRNISGILDPGCAWRTLIESGLIPCDRDRRFAEPVDGDELWPSERPPESHSPSSIHAILTFASDISGKQRAEDLATEFAQRLEPWGAVCDNRVVWYFTNTDYEVTYFKKPYNSARDSVTLSLQKSGFETDSLIPSEESLRI